MFRVTILWLLALALVLVVSASSGDRAQEFEDCVSYCLPSSSSKNCRLSLALRLARWTCLDDCRYQCMHALTDKAIEDGTRIHQYFGKWPFIRLAGIQEPASVLFSVLNGLAHVQGARLVRNKIPCGHPMRPFYVVWSLVSINAWIWSSVFHTRGLRFPQHAFRKKQAYTLSRFTDYRKTRLFLGRTSNTVRTVLHRHSVLPYLPYFFRKHEFPGSHTTSEAFVIQNMVAGMYRRLLCTHRLPRDPTPFRLLLQHGLQSRPRPLPQCTVDGVRVPSCPLPAAQISAPIKKLSSRVRYESRGVCGAYYGSHRAGSL
jgi:Per1-like family